MTPEEVVLLYVECAKYVEESLGLFSNAQINTILNQSSSLQAASINKYDKNIENEEKLNQDRFDISSKKQVCSNQLSKNDLVTLNVGGKPFITCKGTLMRFENSYFYQLMNSDSIKSESGGYYFIDRDPTHFGIIMSYLRTGVIPKLKLNHKQVEELRKEFDYYHLPLAEDLK